MRKLKNTTVSTLTHTFSGYEFLSDVEVEIPEVDADNMLDDQMTNWILDGSILVIHETQELSPEIGRSLFNSRSIALSSSVAIDKNGVDQDISGTDWTVVNHERILWDVNEDYDISTDDFVVPIDGIYIFDCKMRVSSIVNCASIELAVFKRGSPDDYWFIVDRQYPNALSLDEVILHGAIPFDMYQGEHFCIKVIMTKVLPLLAVTATIIGDDDYTAWGFDMSKRL